HRVTGLSTLCFPPRPERAPDRYLHSRVIRDPKKQLKVIEQLLLVLSLQVAPPARHAPETTAPLSSAQESVYHARVNETTQRRYAIVGTGSRARMYTRALVDTHRDLGILVALCDTNSTRMAVH